MAVLERAAGGTQSFRGRMFQDRHPCNWAYPWKAGEAVKKLLAAAVIIAVMVLVVLFGAGRFLVVEDGPPTGEDVVIVLLMGSLPDRVLGAVDLYHGGVAEEIVAVREFMTGYDELQSRNVSIAGAVDLNKEVAVQLDVPEEHFTIIPGGSFSTRDEAKFIRDYLEAEQPGWDSIVLVTSKYHSRRARWIFQRALGENVEVVSKPTPHDPFRPEQWYRHREDAKHALIEYLKLLHFLVWERFGL